MLADRFQRVFLIVLLVGITSAFVAMIRDFLVTLLLAALFTGLMHPVYRRIERWFFGRRALASAVTLVLVFIVVIGPLLGLLGLVATEAYRISQTVGPWIQEQASNPEALRGHLDRIPWIDRLEPYRGEILTRVGQAVGQIGNFLFRSLEATTRGTLTFMFHFGVLLYSMFFFLMDGGRLLRRILYYLPLRHEDEQRMVDRFLSVTRATLKGTIVIGIVQGTLAAMALALAGIQGAAFWGAVMTVLSIIPGVGTALVWGPAAIYLLISGKTVSAILVAAFCGAVVGSMDNLLRPRLVGKDAKLHDLLILFSTIGGLFMFGIVGFIIGPILAALFVTVWDIYGVVFKDMLPAVGETGPEVAGEESDAG